MNIDEQRHIAIWLNIEQLRTENVHVNINEQKPTFTIS